MSTIIIGNVAEGQKWWGTVDALKTRMEILYSVTNPFMNTWKQLDTGTKVFIKLVDGRAHAFIYTSLGKGFFGGGFSNIGGIPHWSSVLEGINFDTDAAIPSKSNLSLPRDALAAANSTSKGYFSGGYDASFVRTEIDSLEFATQTAALVAATLHVKVNYHAGANSFTTAYFYGGYDGDNVSTSTRGEIQTLSFDTEVTGFAASMLIHAREFHTTVGDMAKAYIIGGLDIDFYNIPQIERFQYDNGTISTIAATLAEDKTSPIGVNSASRGYIEERSSLYLASSVEGLDFATETAMGIVAFLVHKRDFCAGVNSSQKGYYSGGYLGFTLGGYTDNIEGIQFGTDTVVNIAATLEERRDQHAGCQLSSVM